MSVVTDPQAVEALLTRFARTTDEMITLAELRTRLLSGKQLVMKYGVDLTAPDLHIGHAVNLWMYRQLQELGHKLVLLLGDFTTQIGDPTGKSRTRPVLSPEQIQSNADGIMRQALKILRADDEVLEIRRNSEWLNAMKPAELLTLMSGVTVDALLARDMFRKRQREGQPIAAHELVYPLLQGWDSVQLEADLTIIGSDQLFNEMMGRTLQERHGDRPQVIITTKITPGIDGGEKQSKSLGNYIAVDHSPREKFGRLMRVPDSLIAQYASVYSDKDDAWLAELDEQIRTKPRDAKAAMAEAIVSRYHGDQVAREEVDWFARTFSEGQLPADAPEVVLDRTEWTALDLCRHILDKGRSTGSIRRLIEQGGVRIDGIKIESPDQRLTLGPEPVGLKAGKREWFVLKFAPPAS